MLIVKRAMDFIKSWIFRSRMVERLKDKLRIKSPSHCLLADYQRKGRNHEK